MTMQVGKDTTVTLNYTLTDGEGNSLEDTKQGGPVTYIHGKQMMLEALEEKIAGKTEGDTLHVEIPAEKAFGEKYDEYIAHIPLSEFTDHENLEVGREIIVNTGEGEMMVVVTDMNDEEVVLDGNHPFAGLDLVFDVEIVEVRETSQEDIDYFMHHYHDDGCDCGEHHHDDDCVDSDGACGDGCCGGCG